MRLCACICYAWVGMSGGLTYIVVTKPSSNAAYTTFNGFEETRYSAHRVEIIKNETILSIFYAEHDDDGRVKSTGSAL